MLLVCTIASGKVVRKKITTRIIIVYSKILLFVKDISCRSLCYFFVVVFFVKTTNVRNITLSTYKLYDVCILRLLINHLKHICSVSFCVNMIKILLFLSTISNKETKNCFISFVFVFSYNNNNNNNALSYFFFSFSFFCILCFIKVVGKYLTKIIKMYKKEKLLQTIYWQHYEGHIVFQFCLFLFFFIICDVIC